MDEYANASYDHRYSGVILVDDKEVACTRQCVHCQHTFLSVRGSGIIRGWCMRCNGTTCGHPDCDACIPWEVRLLAMEGKIDLNNIPVVVSVPRSIGG